MAGKRAGSRRGERTRRRFDAGLLWLSLGVTLLVVAWGYLVYAAIDFGASARGGQTAAWWFLLLASLGAVACLFAGLMLVARILRRLGLTSAPPSGASSYEPPHDSGPGSGVPSGDDSAVGTRSEPGHGSRRVPGIAADHSAGPGHALGHTSTHATRSHAHRDVVEGGQRNDPPTRPPGGRRIKT